MDPGFAENVRHEKPSDGVTTVGFVQGDGGGAGGSRQPSRPRPPEPQRTAGVEGTPSQDPALPPPYSTTYCYRHNALETVDGVEKVRPFIVEEQWFPRPVKTSRSACEVWGFTTAGCSVHFIGGPRWNQ
jgi:hypothetical protein